MPQASHPTIIIGIGSSGLYAIEQLQRYHYEAFKTNKPENVEYLYLETNKDNRVGVTPLPNEIGRVYISLSQMDTMVRNLKKENDNKWLPDPNALMNAGLGAGGIRACGRLALWGSNDEGNNFVNVLNAFETAYRKSVRNAQVQKPTVFVVGSTTGGTGSGIFIDIAYIIRHVIPDIKELFGLLLIPKRPQTITNYEVMYANTYSLMKDLAYYNRENTYYDERWPNGQAVRTPQPPYELVQFMSQDYNDGSPAISNLAGLYKMAGLYLFLNIAGVREKRMERVVDAAGVMQIKHYNTFGFSAIIFPKDQVQEYLATQKSIELLERWIDPEGYYLNNRRYPINRAEIKQEAIKKWDEILTEAFGVLDTTGSTDIMEKLEEDIIAVNKNEQKGDPIKFLREQFTSRKTDNHYGVLRYNVQTAVDRLIEEIHDWYVETLNRTESLAFVKVLLEELINTIGDTIKYWTQKVGIDKETSRWEKVLAREAEHMVKGRLILPRYKEVGEQGRVLKDRMHNTLTLLKMHLLEGKLVEIGRNMKKEDAPKSSSRESSKRLPRLEEIDILINRIKNTIGKDLGIMSEVNEISLHKRLADITAEVQDESVPLMRVYKADNFEKEVENALRQYNQKTNNDVPTKVVVMGGRDLWEYLNSLDYNFERKLYNDAIRKHGEKVAELDCVPDYDVSDYVMRKPSEGKRIASRALAGFISVGNDKVFTPSPYIPRFVVGEDKGKLAQILRMLNEKENFSEFRNSPDGILELPDMRNIMVFYEEKGTFNPLAEISYIQQMRDTYEKFPAYIHGMTAEKWNRDRNAYLTE